MKYIRTDYSIINTDHIVSIDKFGMVNIHINTIDNKTKAIFYDSEEERDEAFNLLIDCLEQNICDNMFFIE